MDSRLFNAGTSSRYALGFLFGACFSLNSKCRKPSVGIRSNKLRQIKSMGNENYDIILHVDLTR